jgi:hypothetical protein
MYGRLLPFQGILFTRDNRINAKENITTKIIIATTTLDAMTWFTFV